MDLFGMNYENEQSKDTINENVKVVANYDIYDFYLELQDLI